jgi:hypothetical protein
LIPVRKAKASSEERLTMITPTRFRHAAILREAHATLAGSGRDLQLKQSRNTAILRKAHELVAEAREQDRLRRCARLAAFKAIAAVRAAYKNINASSMSDIDRKCWRERQELVEAELMRIAKLGSR